GRDVLVDFDEDQARVIEVGLDEFGVHQDVGAAHAETSLSECFGGFGSRRLISRYISQPRQNPNAAFRNAAPSAKAVAMIPSHPIPSPYPTAPITANPSPTPCANRGGASS